MDCFYYAEMSANTLKNAIFGNKGGYGHSAVAEKTQDFNLFEKQNSLFLSYESAYSGSFDLYESMKYPKMCATASINMTDGMTYYRGQNETPYILEQQAKVAGSLGQMDNGMSFLFENGTAATGMIGRWDAQYAGGTIWVQTDSPEAEGK